MVRDIYPLENGSFLWAQRDINPAAHPRPRPFYNSQGRPMYFEELMKEEIGKIGRWENFKYDIALVAVFGWLAIQAIGELLVDCSYKIKNCIVLFYCKINVLKWIKPKKENAHEQHRPPEISLRPTQNISQSRNR